MQSCNYHLLKCLLDLVASVPSRNIYLKCQMRHTWKVIIFYIWRFCALLSYLISWSINTTIIIVPGIKWGKCMQTFYDLNNEFNIALVANDREWSRLLRMWLMEIDVHLMICINYKVWLLPFMGWLHILMN